MDKKGDDNIFAACLVHLITWWFGAGYCLNVNPSPPIIKSFFTLCLTQQQIHYILFPKSTCDQAAPSQRRSTGTLSVFAVWGRRPRRQHIGRPSVQHQLDRVPAHAHVLIGVYVRTCEHMCVFYGCFWFNSAFHLAFVFLLLYQQVTEHMC